MKPRWICLSVVVPGLSLVLVGASAVLGEAKGVVWSEDVDASLKKAAAQRKDVLMDFTGSDWCGWCVRLKEEVFEQKGFYEAASKDFVFVELDFPKNKKLSPETVQQNKLWQEKFGVDGYPTIMLVDAKGKPYAKTGYREGGKDPYLKHLADLRKIRVERDEALAKAAAAAGVEKAKQLDAALSKIDPELVAVAYQDVVEQIVKLDATNQAGLKTRYSGMLGITEIRKLLRARKPAEAMAKADELLKAVGDTGQMAQDLYFARSEACFNKGDKKGAREDLDKALKAAPDGDKVAQIRSIIARVFGGK